ncbi:MAG TPA: flagellar assembly protein FliW [Polyangiaceae bacterium]|nr:flagellar assembly protein FliW [Polyangiaceae bacterium]
MEIATSRFGKISATEDDLIRFPAGIIGFRGEKAFVLVPHGTSTLIGWLQSTSTPELAFPVVSAHGLVDEYPDVDVAKAAERAGIGGTEEELAVLAVMTAPLQQPATVNLLAPLIVNATTRTGAQVFLEGSRFSTQELFAMPRPQPSAPVESGERAVAR